MKPQHTGFVRLFKVTQYSLQGLKAAYCFETAFRQELVLCFFGLACIVYVPVSTTEKVMMVMSLFILLIVELINSAIEAAIDRIGSKHHELSGRAKDLGSAAVLVTMVMIGITWAIILWPLILI